MTDTDDWLHWRRGMDGRVGTLEARFKAEAFARAGLEMDVHTLWPKAVEANRLLQALSETQSEHTATLADHTRRLTRLENKVDTLSVDMAGVKRDVGTLKGDMAGLKGDVSGLKGDVSTLKGDVSTLKGDVRKILDLLESRS
jgi:chromosome segregation ATPase